MRPSRRRTTSQASWNPGPKAFPPCSPCLLSAPLAPSPSPKALAVRPLWGGLQGTDLSSKCVVSQGKAWQVGVDACASLRALRHQTQIKLFYCILSDRSPVHSSASPHLNKTSICHNPINRSPYRSGPHGQAALWLSVKPDWLTGGRPFIMRQDTMQGPAIQGSRHSVLSPASKSSGAALRIAICSRSAIVQPPKRSPRRTEAP